MSLLLALLGSPVEPEEPAVASGQDGAGNNRRRRLYLGPEQKPQPKPEPPKPGVQAAPKPKPQPYNPAIPGVLGDMLKGLVRQQEQAQQLMQAAQAQRVEVEVLQRMAEDDDERAAMAAVEMLMQ
jgi:hypothetical protein